MAFNWREYIQVSDRFGADKIIIEQALDSIAATGADGEALIKLAHAHSPLMHKTIEIVPGSGDRMLEDGGSGIQPMSSPGTLYLSQREMRALFITTPDGERQVSTTGILVHELFHMTDPHVHPKGMLAQLFVNGDLPLETKYNIGQAYLDAWQASTLQEDAEGPAAKLSKEEDSNPLQAKILRIKKQVAETMGVSPDSFSIHPSAFNNRNYKKAIAPQEEITTHYTDVFMHKHFPGEPWRGTYDNAHISYPINPHPVLAVAGTGEYISGVYDPQEACLGDAGLLAQPRIAAPLPQSPNQTRTK